ncbi:MAG: hypothetical protein A3I68_00755 [Candidatus Melainabacteria bacterium RIFCSPLOWO2_02_FULL_35_15]|nr:MAG: hypothetical protein A3I68_00755 [Candidatus Melainabacteria bacterium RIFCSPLOWO2_02_FULL_35_15]
MTNITFHVISHTHWDREWYLPFEVFRIELVELIDNLLNILEQKKDFIFHLDGQTIILQDYLEIKPYKKEQIRKFVESGNLLIGPWYVLSDQFLTSGEAIIRNLLYGMRDVKEYGDVMMVGYNPDQFGQIAQLPQIFKGFNINSALIGRGIQDSIAEHNWFGLNGESILAISLTHWYNNAQRFPEEDTHKYIDKIFETQAKTSRSNHILLMNGCDHLSAQSNLSDILKSVNQNQKWQLQQNSLPEAVKNIINSSNKKNYPICYGELRSDNNKYILAGTLSSRVYLKLLNYKCQTILEKIIEPLAAILNIQQNKIYPYDEIKYAWRLLMQNHAHDSICGCSIDEVHREMELRFLKVNQVLDKIKENLCKDKDTALQYLYLQIINLTNFYRNDVIEAELEVPMGPPSEHPSATPTVNRPEIKNLALKLDGKEVTFHILENYMAYKMIRSKDEVPLLQAIQKIKILLETNVKPFSAISYEICTETEKEARKQGNFENQNYKLEINKDGSFNISLKEKKCKFENIHFITIENDKGDEYNFVQDEFGTTLSSKDWSWSIKVTEENNLRKKIILATSDVIDIKIELTCYRNSDRIDFRTKIQNTLKNKRIRLHFPDNLQANYITADTPFGIIQRACPPADWINYANSQPLHNWIDHSNDESGLAFFGGGLADYELFKDGNGFAVTLIRAIGRLSSVKSHSLIETPEAQCNREIEFTYAIYPHTGNREKKQIQNEFLIYQTPLIINQSGSMINFHGLITVSPKLTVSSFKRSEDKENLYILRVFNPNNKELNNCEINLNFRFKKLYFLDLNEEITSIVNNDKLVFKAEPFQILTFGIEI